MQSSIVLLPGDGIGPEVVAAAERVLRLVADRFGHRFEISSHPIGGAALKSGLPPLPEATRAACQEADAVLLGAVGDPAFDRGSSEGRPETGLLQLRQALGVFANLRPAKVWPGMEDGGPFKPELITGVDLLIVRELLGGIYFGEPRGIAKDRQSAFNTMRYSRPEVERIAEVAFKAAQGRRKLVTSVDKANVLETSRMWRRVVTEVAADYDDVELEHILVDNAAMQIVQMPERFDVMVCDNMFGDILSDEAAAVTGGLGLAASASLGDKGPGIFEPVHGSAPDIAGQGIANPAAMLRTVALMLGHGLGEHEQARAVEQAVDWALETTHTPDLGGVATTQQFGDAVLAALS